MSSIKVARYNVQVSQFSRKYVFSKKFILFFAVACFFSGKWHAYLGEKERKQIKRANFLRHAQENKPSFAQASSTYDEIECHLPHLKDVGKDRWLPLRRRSSGRFATLLCSSSLLQRGRRCLYLDLLIFCVWLCVCEIIFSDFYAN